VLLDVGFLADLAAEQNVLNTELQGENKTIIQLTGTTDSFRGKMKLWKTQIVNIVLTHYPDV
jgi:hypothetical protein